MAATNLDHVSAYIGKGQRARLDELVKRTELTKAEHMRRALAAYLDIHAPVEPESEIEYPVVFPSPRDLQTNP